MHPTLQSRRFVLWIYQHNSSIVNTQLNSVPGTTASFPQAHMAIFPNCHWKLFKYLISISFIKITLSSFWNDFHKWCTKYTKSTVLRITFPCDVSISNYDYALIPKSITSGKGGILITKTNGVSINWPVNPHHSTFSGRKLLWRVQICAELKVSINK